MIEFDNALGVVRFADGQVREKTPALLYRRNIMGDYLRLCLCAHSVLSRHLR